MKVSKQLLPVVLCLLAGPAAAHYNWVETRLVAMSPDGRVGLLEVTEGDTEGGAMGERLVVRRLDGATAAPGKGKGALLGEDPGALAQETVLVYKPSPGFGMSHTKKELKNGERRRKRFMKRVKKKYALVDPVPVRESSAFGVFPVSDSALRIRYDCGKPPSTVLELAGTSVPLPPVEPDRLNHVVRVWSTGDPRSVVMRIEPAWLEDWKNCMPPKGKPFGPPPRAYFRRITF